VYATGHFKVTIFSIGSDQNWTGVIRHHFTMSPESGFSIVSASAIVMIAVIGDIDFVFLFLACIMTRFRWSSLNKAIRKPIDNPKNDGRRVTHVEIGRMHGPQKRYEYGDP
jgi:hypothetical protein